MNTLPFKKINFHTSINSNIMDFVYEFQIKFLLFVILT